MQSHVDPFADRSRPGDPGDRSAGGATPEIDPLDDGDIGLTAIVEDQVFGRREAPFAADPSRRVRAVGE